MGEYEKTGYLAENFRMFHLTDSRAREFPYHYHDFNKILIFFSGNVTYSIEGRFYDLKPNDIVFVNAGEVHRPIVKDDAVYERVILYVSPDFLASGCENMFQKTASGGTDFDLSLCFRRAHEKQSHVLRAGAPGARGLFSVVHRLEAALDDNDYAGELYRTVLFLEFMIQLNRAALHDSLHYIRDTSSNEKVLAVLDYLNAHLTDDLTIDGLAGHFYLNRYYLMHTFKAETGYTIGGYLSTKRLILAKDLVKNGMSVTEACYECGFKNYSTFSRAYKKRFGEPPRELRQSAPSPRPPQAR